MASIYGFALNQKKIMLDFEEASAKAFKYVYP